jgi:type I restriction enzyme S subunit
VVLRIKTCKLGDVLNFKRGYDLPKKVRVDGTVPIISSSGHSGFHNEAKVKAPGVVTGRYGTLGEVFYIDEDFWPLNTSLYVQDFKGNHPRYLSYFLTMLDIAGLNAAGAVPGVNRNHLHMLNVEIIERYEDQATAAESIESYDNLIENNNRRIAILEDMAQSLYREWFVKFRFPRHEGCQFKDSPLGRIPEGWGVKSLEEVLETIIDYRGKTPKKLGGDWIDSGIKALSALNVKNGGLIRLEACKQVGVDIFEKWMKVKLRKDDILLTSEAPLGEVALLKGETEYCLSQRLFALRANIELVSPEYIFLALFSGHLLGQLTSRATGATVAGIRQALLKEVPIVTPPRDVINQFTQIADSLLSEKNVLWRKNINLKQQRDMLLPKLISGSISI